MKKKYFNYAFFGGIYAVTMLGVVLPWLMSQRSYLTVGAGSVLMLGTTYFIGSKLFTKNGDSE